MRSVDCGCTNNAVPYQLRNGSILMAGTCGNSHPSLHGADGEQITLAIADKNHFFGPFRKIAGQGFGEREPNSFAGLASRAFPAPKLRRFTRSPLWWL